MRIIFLFYFLSIILAQNSKIIQPTISSGFVQTNGLKGTLGQTFFQKLESDNVSLNAGFWGGRFDKFRGPFGDVMTNSGPSRPPPWTPEGLLALRTSRESSGAHPRLFFGRFSDLKKLPFQGLDFLTNNFLIVSWGVLTSTCE